MLLTPNAIDQARQHMTPQEEAELMRLMTGDGVYFPDQPLVEYVKDAWKVVEPETVYQHNWHIDVICEHLEAATFSIIRNLIINIQPRHMKSLLVAVFWPTWVWSFMPYTRWLFLSYSRELSTRDNEKRRRIIQSAWYQDRWGKRASLMFGQQQKTRFNSEAGGHMISQGLSGTGLGGDYVVGDDILSREHAYSEPRRDRSADVWEQTVSTRINNPKTGVKVMIAQRLHADDPIGRIIKKENDGGERYDKLIIRTEYEPEKPDPPTSLGWVDPRTKKGELLWPERYNLADIERLKKTLGEFGSASMLQQRPSGVGGNILKRHWWRFWIPAGSGLPPAKIELGDGEYFTAPTIELPNDLNIHAQSWDCSFDDKKTSSWVVGQVWATRSIYNQFFLIDQEHHHWGFPATVEGVREVSKRHPRARAKLVEAKANGVAVIQYLTTELTGMLPINPQGSKEARAHVVSPIAKAGNIYLPHPSIAPWVLGLIKECAEFPASANDDRLDALTQMIIYWTQNTFTTYGERVKVESEKLMPQLPERLRKDKLWKRHGKTRR
jgi:predicted phage terminase large subunit-like protein